MLKRIFSAWAVCALVLSVSIVCNVSVICVGAVDNADVERIKKENKIENYDLKRVLFEKNESVSEGENQPPKYTLEYEHQRTGARFVCWGMDSAQTTGNVGVFYKVPSEDNTGAVHALEHCIYGTVSFAPEDDPDFAPRAFTLPVGVYFNMPNIPKNSGCCANDVSRLIDVLKNPKFLSNEDIFKTEVFNQIRIQNGKPLTKGRVFLETAQKHQFKMPNKTQTIYENSIMNSNNKFKFQEGGTPAEICNCSYKKVCDLYHKYIHPSNMLVLVSDSNFKDIMRQFDEKYMDGFEKKDIIIDYKLPNADMGSFFKEYSVGGVGAALNRQENYKYCAVAAYPLGPVKDCDARSFRNICCALNELESNEYLKKLGFDGVDASICSSPDCDYLKVAIMGNDSKKFDEKSLSLSFNNILSKAIETGKVSGCYFRSNFGIPHDEETGRLLWSYALCDDVFSDRFFTIKENEICYDRMDDNARLINKNLAQKFTEKPAEIVLLKDNGSWTKKASLTRKFKLAFCQNDIGKIRLAMRILNRGLVTKELQERGAVYHDLWLSSSASNKELKYFCSSEDMAFDNILDFFENDFAKKVKNFEVSDELFNLVKNNIIQNRIYLTGLSNYIPKSTDKRKIFDSDAYYSDDFAEESDILSISKDEIQEFIKTARFVGYDVAE